MHLGQCPKTLSTPTTRAWSGALPFTFIVSRSELSFTMIAFPLTRSVCVTPGMRKIIPTLGSRSTLWKVSKRRFPSRSGIARVCSSSTFTKPAGSPLGETSTRPASPTEATNANGACSINERAMLSMDVTTLATEWLRGSPTAARSSSSVDTTSRNVPVAR